MKIELIESFQKKLSEMERRVEMLDRIPVGLVTLDNYGTIVLSNSFFWRIIGSASS